MNRKNIEQICISVGLLERIICKMIHFPEWSDFIGTTLIFIGLLLAFNYKEKTKFYYVKLLFILVITICWLMVVYEFITT